MSENEVDQSAGVEEGVMVVVGILLVLELGCLELDSRVAQASWGESPDIFGNSSEMGEFSFFKLAFCQVLSRKSELNF